MVKTAVPLFHTKCAFYFMPKDALSIIFVSTGIL